MLDKIPNTEEMTTLGVIRVKRNLDLEVDDVICWCREKIQNPDARICRRGKNWYVDIDDCEITVNAYSCTIITAHKIKNDENNRKTPAEPH